MTTTTNTDSGSTLLHSVSHEAWRDRDSQGRIVVRVVLPDRQCVFLNEEDFTYLMDHKFTLQWFIKRSKGNPYVCLQDQKGKQQAVSRLIMDAGHGQVVKYRDGDRSNLRRSNLEMTGGPATAQAQRSRQAAEAAQGWP